MNVTVRMIAALLLSFLAPALCSATTWEIRSNGSGDAPTIQAGIDLSVTGDTVLVTPGTYTGAGNRDLLLEEKNIVLLSEMGPDVTIIDCEQNPSACFNFFLQDSSQIEGFTIRNAGGGGIRVRDFSAPVFVTCVVESCTRSSGGAIYATESSPNFVWCSFIGNQSSGHGGAVFLDDFVTTTFLACTFAGNRAGNDGGALYMGSSENSAEFDSCLFAGNSAADEGGAVWAGGTYESHLLFANCTITRNWSDVPGGIGGLHFSGGKTTRFFRTILWGNRGYEAEVSLNDTLAFYNSDVNSTQVNSAGELSYDANTIFTDPLFCAPGAFEADPDYYLAENSPCFPDNNPGGELVGAFSTGSCGSIVAWDGGGDATNWNDPLNWTGNTLPSTGDLVQMTLAPGDTVYAPNISIPAPAANALRLDLFDDDFDSATATGVLAALDTVQLLDGARIAGSLLNAGGIIYGGPAEIVEVEVGGKLTLEGGAIESYESLVNYGTVIARPPGVFALGIPLENVRDTLLGIAALVEVEAGTLAVGATVKNSANIVMLDDADILIGSIIENNQHGVFEFDGSTGTNTLGGGGRFDNLGTVVMSGTHTAKIDLLMNNYTVGLDTGLVDVFRGTIGIANQLNNEGKVLVESQGAFDIPGTIHNEGGALLEIAGQCTGSGTVTNYGLIRKTDSGASTFTPAIWNLIDAQNNAGALVVEQGFLEAGTIFNQSSIEIQGGTVLTINDSLENWPNATIGGSGTLQLVGGLWNEGRIEPGFSPGTLYIDGDFSMLPSAEIDFEIGGVVPGVNHDLLVVSGAATFEGSINVLMIDGYVPAPNDTFDVVLFGSRLVSSRAGDFSCFSGLEVDSIYLNPVQTPTMYLLVASDTAGTPPNDPPMAVDDTDTTVVDPVTVEPLVNDVDPDAQALTIAGINTSRLAGSAVLDVGDTSITYFPSYTFTGNDTLTYYATDCAGGVDSAIVVFRIGDATSVDGNGEITPPLRFGLQPNAPNPFNPATRIRFDLSDPGRVVLQIYDVRGRLVRTLLDEHRAAGQYELVWNGTSARGRELPSGLYFLRMESNNRSDTRKIVLVR